MNHSVVALISKIDMTKAFKYFHVSKILMMLFQIMIMFNDIISPDQSIIHGNKEMNRNIDQVIVIQIVEGFLSAIILDVLFLSIVESLKFSRFPIRVEMLAQVCRETKLED